MYSLDPMLAAKAAEGARLHFSGDLTWWLAGLIGLGAAGLAAWIYRGIYVAAPRRASGCCPCCEVSP